MDASVAGTEDNPSLVRRPAIPSAVLGMLFFVVAEVMFFSGAISAFTISRAGALPGTWPVPGQPLLPAEATALNTGLLILSGVVLMVAQRFFARGSSTAPWLTLASWVLGAAFVVLQGVEWVALLTHGLTLTSSRLGSFFYLIVGAHALHVIAALMALGWAWRQMVSGRLVSSAFWGVQTFWYFVVLLWPVIYARVYF